LSEHHAAEPQLSFYKRYQGLISLAILVAVVTFLCGFLPNIQTNVLGIPKAARPVITLPGEKITATPLIDLGDKNSNIYLTNTLVATAIADVLVILIALVARAGLKEVPRGFSNVVEFLIEFLYNSTEQAVGSKWGQRLFPIAATIFIFILVANWMHFIPGVDTIGVMHHPDPGEPSFTVGQWGGALIYAKVDDPGGLPAPAKAGAVATPIDEAAPCVPGDMCVVTPFVRAAATDINLPLALAVVAFVTIQGFGIANLGWWYPAKFVNAPALGRGGMGIMDFGVGLFELVLEPFKIISLTLRLLGNIFGGGVLLVVISSLIAFVVPVGLYLFEMFVGAIQAYVFFILTVVFTSMAIAGHAGGDSH